ncbi:MAG: hypothetical protein PW792_08600 [Acidobacteriaceae bacterium]|nr:hypothetical protein [Acidobacteriaceae bacterium]
MMRKHVYQLTNLHFLGSRITTFPDGSWSRDTLDFAYKDVRCTLQQAEGYRETIKELSRTHGAGITATLTLETDIDRPQHEMDELADAACELLAFATKNEVFWAKRDTFDENGSLVSGKGRSLGARVRDFHEGWSILNDVVITKDNGHRDELQIFLRTVFERYFDTLRAKLKLPLMWIAEAEHFGFVDLNFMTLFIAMERLKSEFAPKKKQDFLHLDWQRMLDGELAKTVLSAIQDEVGPLSPEQEKAIIGKLRGANTPSTGVQIDEFCRSLGVKGLEKDMTELRNKLTHTAAYGNFDLPKVLSLHVELSHVVDVCVLKILGYRGYYCHRATDWRNVSLDEESTAEDKIS